MLLQGLNETLHVNCLNSAWHMVNPQYRFAALKFVCLRLVSSGWKDMSVMFPYELWVFSSGNISFFRSSPEQRAGAFDFWRSPMMIKSRLQFLGRETQLTIRYMILLLWASWMKLGSRVNFCGRLVSRCFICIRNRMGQNVLGPSSIWYSLWSKVGGSYFFFLVITHHSTALPHSLSTFCHSSPFQRWRWSGGCHWERSKSNISLCDPLLFLRRTHK